MGQKLEHEYDDTPVNRITRTVDQCHEMCNHFDNMQMQQFNKQPTQCLMKEFYSL